MLQRSSSISSSGHIGLRPVLMDFGLARQADEGGGLTESGVVLGTPAYMAPEQARGDVRQIDRRSDVYGLGATLYELLVGAPPFVGDASVNIILQVLGRDPVSPRARNPQIPESLDTIVLKCLNKEPHQRYQDAAELAEDLDRVLHRQRVRARRLGWAERLYWKGRRNKPLAAATSALVLCVLTLCGYGVHSAILRARAERLAVQRAALAQKLGQAVQDLEWTVRTAHLIPLHDTGPDMAIVRARMAEVEVEMRSFGALSAGLDHYALGRGHLALSEWDAAYRDLKAAEAAGVQEVGLQYALGRVLGERYSRALQDARRGGDRGYFERRKRELDAEYLNPLLTYLSRSRGLKTVSPSYLEGLIDFYQGRHGAALLHAQFARRSTPWLYEAAQLEGDVHMAQALQQRDHGDAVAAERSFAQAVARYGEAAEIGRSDARLYAAMAEAWIRQEEMDMYRGRDPRPKMEQALAAADRALAADPKDADAYVKKAFAYHFQARYAGNHEGAAEQIRSLLDLQIRSGELATEIDGRSASAMEMIGTGYSALAEYGIRHGEQPTAMAQKACAYLEKSLALSGPSPWTLNDYGTALALHASIVRARHEDPERLFAAAMAAFRQAVALDDDYFLAHSNLSGWLQEWASWQLEQGRDPSETLHSAVQSGERAIQINAQHPLAYGNSGLAHIMLATWKLDHGQDGGTDAQAAVDRLQQLIQRNPALLPAYADLATAYKLLYLHRRLQPNARDAARAAAGQALRDCQTRQTDSATCQRVQKLLHI